MSLIKHQYLVHLWISLMCCRVEISHTIMNTYFMQLLYSMCWAPCTSEHFCKCRNFAKPKARRKHLQWLKLHFQLAINTENRAAECSAVISYGTMMLVLQNTTQELRQLLTKPRGLGALNKALKVFYPKTRH